MAETGIQKEFESAGVFWIPGSEAKVAGRLKYSPVTGPQLELVGGFGSSVFQYYPVVHGALADNKCSLFGCNSSGVNQGEIVQTSFEPSLVVIGEHVPSLDEAFFSGLKVRFSGLDDWVNHRAVAAALAAPHEIGKTSKFEVTSQTPIVATSAELGGSVTLGGQPSGRHWHRRIDWEYHSYFEVNFEKLASLRQLHSAAFELQHFFALLTWHRSPIAYFSAFRSTGDAGQASGRKNWSGLYAHWPVAADNQRSSGHFLTALADVSTELPGMVNLWFRSPLGVKTARHLFTSVIRSEDQYLEFMFLAVMQIVEALHRSLDSRTYLPQQEYETVRQILTAAIPRGLATDLRASLESRIKYGNELSLRTRLKELFLKLPKSLRAHICNDWKAFVGHAVDIRNALTHPNADGKYVKPDETQLQQASQRIKLLLTVILLNELGLSFEKIEKIAAGQRWQSLTRD